MRASTVGAIFQATSAPRPVVPARIPIPAACAAPDKPAAPKVNAVLMSPRVTKAQKSHLLAEALSDAPREFVLFLQAVVKRGRQALFGEMAGAYLGLVDQKFNRVRAAVTVARPVDEALRRQVALSCRTCAEHGCLDCTCP